MAGPYSHDLRERVVSAVEPAGMSRHQAGAHFGVAVSTAIGWVKCFRQTGSVAPGQMGGHKPRTISGKHREWLIERCQAGDFTLRGLVGELACERSLKCHATCKTHPVTTPGIQPPLQNRGETEWLIR